MAVNHSRILRGSRFQTFKDVVKAAEQATVLV
jgi:hypothetical protein